MRTLSGILAFLVLAATLQGCPASQPTPGSMAVTRTGPKGLPVNSRTLKRPSFSRQHLYAGHPASQRCTAHAAFNCIIRSRWTGTSAPRCGYGFFAKALIPAPPIWACVHLAHPNWRHMPSYLAHQRAMLFGQPHHGTADPGGAWGGAIWDGRRWDTSPTPEEMRTSPTPEEMRAFRSAQNEAREENRALANAVCVHHRHIRIDGKPVVCLQ